MFANGPQYLSTHHAANANYPPHPSIWPEIARLESELAEQLAVDARYAVYVKRQELDIAAFRKDEGIAIPSEFAFAALPGLSTELRQTLEQHRPPSLGQGGRPHG